MFKLIGSLLLVALLSSSAFAGFKAEQKYGTAGCGLGSMIFGDKEGPLQILAATTNGSSGTQTFGITSGTSNCQSGNKTMAMFIDVNKANLKTDIARGHGETLTSLATLSSCQNTKNFNRSLKQNYNSIFENNTSKDIAEKIQKLTSNCQA